MAETPADHLVVKPQARASCVAHAWLKPAVHVELAREANRRRLHPDALTAQIVDRVVRGGLVDAILDDPRLA